MKLGPANTAPTAEYPEKLARSLAKMAVDTLIRRGLHIRTPSGGGSRWQYERVSLGPSTPSATSLQFYIVLSTFGTSFGIGWFGIVTLGIVGAESGGRGHGGDGGMVFGRRRA